MGVEDVSGGWEGYRGWEGGREQGGGGGGEGQGRKALWELVEWDFFGTILVASYFV